MSTNDRKPVERTPRPESVTLTNAVDPERVTLTDEGQRLLRLDPDKFAEVRARLAAYWTASGRVNEAAVTLMAAWEVATGKPVGAGDVATFAEMASAVVATDLAAREQALREEIASYLERQSKAPCTPQVAGMFAIEWAHEIRGGETR